MAKKQIFLVYACDLWKGRDSMRLVLFNCEYMENKGWSFRKVGE